MRFLGSITNRIFLASALLAMLSIGAAVYFVSARMTTQTELELQRDLTEAATLVDDQRRTLFDNFARTATLIADLPKFKAAVDIGDRPTIAPIALDYLSQAGADLLIVTGRGGEELAHAGETAGPALTAGTNDAALASDGKGRRDILGASVAACSRWSACRSRSASTRRSCSASSASATCSTIAAPPSSRR